MSERSYGPKRARRGWSSLLAIVVVSLVAIFPRPASSGSQGDITGTVSRAEPPVKQDGTPAHPYTDASQCPEHTDLIIWPSGRSIPAIPPGISVCFVGSEPLGNSGSGVQVRQR